jgi:hypothetical protein
MSAQSGAVAFLDKLAVEPVLIVAMMLVFSEYVMWGVIGCVISVATALKHHESQYSLTVVSV